MKIAAMTLMAALVGVAAEPQVTVCMASSDYFLMENQAKIVSSAIFAGIGVKIRWHGPSNCPPEGILITLSDETPGSLLPGALAYVLPFEGTHVVVFYDRAKNRPGSVSSVLGHVVAHEVAHILQRRHSGSGPHEGAMDRHRLPRNDLEAARVHRGRGAADSKWLEGAVARH